MVPYDIKAAAALTGTRSVRAGVLSTDAHFDVELAYGVLDRTMITLSASETTNNFSYADLVEDINNAISETDANGLVHAEWDVRADRLSWWPPGRRCG